MQVCYLVSALGGQTLGLQSNLVDVADHVEGDLGQVIVLAGQDVLEPSDSLVNGDKLARVVGEHLSDLEGSVTICQKTFPSVLKLYSSRAYLEGLRQEPLDLPRPGDLDLVLKL